VIKQLFSANDNTIEQTDVIVLLTPRVVRSHELKQQDLDPMVIGTPTTLGLGGPSPLIVQPPAAPQAGGPAPAAGVAGAAAPPPAPAAGQPPAPTAQPQPPPAAAATAQPQPAPPLSGTGVQLALAPSSLNVPASPPGGALTVPITVVGNRLSSVTLTVTYNPAVLRARAVQQATFMGTAGGPVAFSEDHANPGRIDIVMLRTGDNTGATGTGTLAVLLFDLVAPGPANLTLTGTATAPGGAALQVQVTPPPGVTVK
jgi:hypothetical protein